MKVTFTIISVVAPVSSAGGLARLEQVCSSTAS